MIPPASVLGRGYDVAHAALFDGTTGYLSRLPVTPGNRKTFVVSAWVKRAKLGAYQVVLEAASTRDCALRFTDTDSIDIFFDGSTSAWLVTAAKYRDPAAWLHVVVAVDTTQATASDRIRLWVNGVRVTAFSTETYPTQDFTTEINNTVEHRIGRDLGAASQILGGYLGQVVLLDGATIADPKTARLGEYDKAGVWRPVGLTAGVGHLPVFTLPTGTITASSEASTYVAANAVDGNGATYWSSSNTAGEQWWRIQPAAPTAIRHWRLHQAPSGVGAVSLKDYRIEASDTGAFAGEETVLATGAHPNTFDPEYVDTGNATTFAFYRVVVASTYRADDYKMIGDIYWSDAGGGFGTNGCSLDFADATAPGRDAGERTVVLSNAYLTPPRSCWSTSGLAFVNGVEGDLVNGDPVGTVCVNNPVGATMTIDAGEGRALDLTKWEFHLRAAYVSETWSIQYSDNGADWVDAVTGFQVSATGWNSAGWTSVGAHQYWRAIVTTQVNGEYYGEIRVFGSGTCRAANDWTVNGSVSQCVDTPGVGVDQGLATLNPTARQPSDGSELQNGNRTLFNSSASAYTTKGTMVAEAPTYFEITMPDDIYGTYPRSGMYPMDVYDLGEIPGFDANTGFGVSSGGYINVEGATTFTSGVNVTSSDVVMIAYKPATGQVWAGKNGTWWNSGDPVAGTGDVGTISAAYRERMTIAASTYSSARVTFHMSADDWTYAAPSGFKALQTANLPTPTVKDGSRHFEALTYTGNGTAQTIVGTDWGGDDQLVWIKSRSEARSHKIYDSVRGAGNAVFTDTTGIESFSSTYLSAFNDGGFDVGSNPGDNGSGQSIVAWRFRAGTSASNTDGTIAATVSANSTAGFSIVSFTGNGTQGATVGHGLGRKPGLILSKNRDNATESWIVYHAAVGATQFAMLDRTDPFTSTNAIYRWNDTEPTDAVYSVGTNVGVNGNGERMIAYCFADVPGFSAIGSYTGNGSADGPFVWTGFRPAFVMLKRTDGASDWTVIDTARDAHNPCDARLQPNTSTAEAGAYNVLDALSNGFKLRDNNGGWNASGGTYVYIAFAEHPFGGRKVSPVPGR